MDTSNPYDNVLFQKEKSTLIRTLLLYAIILTLCRWVGPHMRYVSCIEWGMYRKDLTVRMPYYLMPFIGLFWLKWRKFSCAGLIFVGGMGLLGVLNHGGAVFIPLRWRELFLLAIHSSIGGSHIGMHVLAALILAVVFAFIAFWFFRTCKRLYRRKSVSDAPSGLSRLFAVLLLLFCHVFPFTNFEVHNLAGWLTTFNIEKAKPYVLDSRIQHMASSPDGKLLALGAEEGIYVWDVDTEQCVWSDNSVGANRIYFSPSGKYLAAAGRGIPGEKSGLAVFEVNGFQRLPGFEWAGEDLAKEKIIHDIVFRPDEKSLLVAWHQDWNWSLIPGGENGEEAGVIRSQEIEEERRKGETPANSNARHRDLFCNEFELVNGEQIYSKAVAFLSVVNELKSEGGIAFSPDASALVFLKCGVTDQGVITRNRLNSVNTKSWMMQDIVLDPKYSVHTRVGNYSWNEWCFSRDGKYMRFLVREIDGMGVGTNVLGYLVLELDIQTGATREIMRQPNDQKIRTDPWTHIAVSPDDKQLILSSFGERLYHYNDRRIVSVRLVDLSGENASSRLLARQFSSPKSAGTKVVWAGERKVAVVLGMDRGSEEFFFFDIH